MQRLIEVLVVGSILLGLGACASTKDIIVDTKGVDMAKYQQDVTECESYAKQVSTAEEAAQGGVAGAVVGGAIGAILGDHHTAARHAGVGGTLGAAKGAKSAENEKERVLRNCLRGRGYRVLN